MSLCWLSSGTAPRPNPRRPQVGRPLLLPLLQLSHANGGPSAQRAILGQVLAALEPLRKPDTAPVEVHGAARLLLGAEYLIQSP